jgi:hypothetical protein
VVTASSPITAVGFTMACWYNPVSVSSTRDLISIANSGNTTDYFNLQQNSTGAVRVRSADSTTQSSAVTATTATANTWQLAVGVIAATNSRTAYLNGTGKGTSSTSRSTTGVNRIGIGANVGSTPASFFGGNISNVCIWDRVLSDEEIYLLYNPATRWCLYDTSRVFFLAGATQYNSNVSGTLTSGGAILKQTGKPLSGTLTTAGALLKQAVKALVGTLTTSGALLKQPSKVLAGTLTTAGTLTKQAKKLLAGTLTTAGALVRTANKILAGTLTSTGALTKQTSKVLAGTLTSAGALLKQAKKLLAGTLTTAGALIASHLVKRFASFPQYAQNAVGAFPAAGVAAQLACTFCPLARGEVFW